jgi:hypothetical protein
MYMPGFPWTIPDDLDHCVNQRHANDRVAYLDADGLKAFVRAQS